MPIPNKLKAQLIEVVNALDYGNTLTVPGVLPADVGAVVFDTANALAATLAAGADPITDADLTAAGIPLTAAQFAAQVVPLLSDYLNFMGNVDTAAADRKTIANRARTDI